MLTGSAHQSFVWLSTICPVMQCPSYLHFYEPRWWRCKCMFSLPQTIMEYTSSYHLKLQEQETYRAPRASVCISDRCSKAHSGVDCRSGQPSKVHYPHLLGLVAGRTNRWALLSLLRSVPIHRRSMELRLFTYKFTCISSTSSAPSRHLSHLRRGHLH